MNRTNTQELVNQWGKWLGTESWDYFTTITYKHNHVQSNLINFAEKYQMNDFHSIDIDDFNDWKIAEACLKNN